MDTSLVYRAVAAGDLEFLKTLKPEIDTFASPAAKNTILHIYITTLSKREKESTMLQKLAIFFKSHFQEPPADPRTAGDTVRAMIESWPSLPWTANERGDTPLHAAARHGQNDVVEALIDHVRKNYQYHDQEDREDHELEMGHGHDRFLLLQERAAVWKVLHATNEVGETALHEAVRYEHDEVVRVLIGEDDPTFLYSPNGGGETPLYLAAERDSLEVIGMILEKYASPAYEGPDGRTALHVASYNATVAILKREELKFLTTKVDNRGRTPLHYMTFMLEYDKSAALVVDNDGNTALHIAAAKGRSWAVEQFIEECPECFEVVDKQGRNALHLAIESGSTHTVNLILYNQFLCDLLKDRDNNGDTPLHLVARSSDYHWPGVIEDGRLDRMANNKDKLNPSTVLYRRSTFSNVEARKMKCMFEAGIYPDTISSIDSETKNIKESYNENNICEEENLKEERQSHLVVAALIATVTFAAGFTLPGGYIQDKGKTEGHALLTKDAAFAAFIISDTFGLAFSCAAVFIHLLMAVKGHKEKDTVEKLFGKALPLTLLAIVAMVIAFITGTYCVLAHSRSLAVSASVIGGVFFYLLGYLVEEARESERFPVFRWILHGTLHGVEWTLDMVRWGLMVVPYMFELVFSYVERVFMMCRSREEKTRRALEHSAFSEVQRSVGRPHGL